LLPAHPTEPNEGDEAHCEPDEHCRDGLPPATAEHDGERRASDPVREHPNEEGPVEAAALDLFEPLAGFFDAHGSVREGRDQRVETAGAIEVDAARCRPQRERALLRDRTHDQLDHGGRGRDFDRAESDDAADGAHPRLELAGRIARLVRGARKPDEELDGVSFLAGVDRVRHEGGELSEQPCTARTVGSSQ